jgi:RimJ/RimL family protein N-acetyltransferase
MLIGEHLRLRPPQECDRTFLGELFADDAVLHNLAGSTARAAEMVEEMCNPTAKPNGKVYWIAEQQSDAQQIGYASALRYDTPRVEISLAILPLHRRHRYGYDLVNVLVRHLADVPHVRTVVAVIKYWNVAPRRIVESLGFEPLSLTVYEKTFAGR